MTITDLDPLRFGLLFERFLNPERVSMPDFDVDFCQENRGKSIEYVQNKYGHDKVAQIITFGKLQAKARITSYNVCYTKLLRTHSHEDHYGAIGRLWSKLKCPIYATQFTSELINSRLDESSLVITSYSIHYTKLYELVWQL